MPLNFACPEENNEPRILTLKEPAVAFPILIFPVVILAPILIPCVVVFEPNVKNPSPVL